MKFEEGKIAVFVYGSLKKGYGNNQLLKYSEFLGEDETADERFDLYCWGSFPAVYKGGKTSIKGELYLVCPATLENLDRLEGYPLFYNRARFRLASGVVAWMYYIDEEGEREGTLCPSGYWTREPVRRLACFH